MQLFFHPDLNEHIIVLPEDESKHLLKVLRKKKSDTMLLIDGKGNEASGIIVSDNPKKTTIEISSILHHKKNRNCYLHIAIAPTKQSERMDWFIEKAIETGIDEITFIETHNTERDKINIERCEKIAIAAIKQSKQYWLPKINGIKKIEPFLNEHKTNNALNLMAWCEVLQTNTLGSKLKSMQPQNICILIGPEGDFTTEEIKLAQSFNYTPVSLGSNILRTETAGVFACAAVALLVE